MNFWYLVQKDIQSRYGGSSRSLLWAVASPLVTILIYWFVYTVALSGNKVTLQGEPMEYLPFLLGGILPWFFFSEGLLGCVTVYGDYGFSVCNLQYPVEKFPLIRLCGSLVLHGILFGLGYLVLTILGVPVRGGQLWVPVWMAGGFFLTLALGRIFSLLHVLCKDVGYAVNVAVQLGFWLTPVFWSPDSLPDWLSSLSLWNPVATLVEGYRRALLLGSLPESNQVLIFWGEVLALYGISVFVMKKIKPTLADRL